MYCDLNHELSTENIINFIKSNGSTTMGQLADWFQGTKGNFEWGVIDHNLIFWIQMSENFIDVMNKVKNSKQVQMLSASPLIYLMDGKGYLKLPIAKTTRKYKSRRWCPIHFVMATANTGQQADL